MEIFEERAQAAYDKMRQSKENGGKLKEYAKQIFEEPISLENEERVWDLIYLKASMAIDRFPETLEEDQEILIVKKLSFNEKNAILLRKK